MSALEEVPAQQPALMANEDAVTTSEDAGIVRLLKAVAEGDLETVKELLPASGPASTNGARALVHVNVTDSAGFTPLIIATRMQHEDIVRYLLTIDEIDVNALTRLRNTAFLYACAKGNVTLAKLLLENGANFMHANVNGDNCLLNACAAGSEETVKFLLEAFHEIQKAKAQHAGLHAPAAASAAGASSGGGAAPALRGPRFVTQRNAEGLTTLMCAVMSGSMALVKRLLVEARQELGIVLPPAQIKAAASKSNSSAGGDQLPLPSARTQFFPSVWPDVFGGPLQYDPQAFHGYVDPAPPAFLAWVNVQNASGDTALHIAAQQQQEELFTFLIDYAGADPGRVNRRNKLAVHLFDQAAGKDGEASSSQQGPSIPAVVSRLAAHWKTLVDFQSARRGEYLARKAAQSDKLFSELMEEEEEAQARSMRKAAKQSGGAAKKKAKAAAAKGKKNETNAAASSDAASGSSTPSASPRLSAAASPAAPSAVVVAAAASPSLSPAAAPFVPGASSSASAADSTPAGEWEVVVPKAVKKAAAAAAHEHVPAAAPAASQEKKAPATKQAKSQKTNEKKPVAAVAAGAAAAATPAAAVTAAPTATPTAAASAAPAASPPAPASTATTASTAPAAATAAATAAASAAPVTAPAVAAAGRTGAASPVRLPYTLVPVPAPAPSVSHGAAPTPSALAAAAAAAAAGTPIVTSPFFAAFTTRPRTAWRPIPALQRRAVGGELSAGSSSAASGATAPSPTPTDSAAASSSSAAAAMETLTALQTQLQSLHPHVESTDLQLSHVLGADWGSLSMSQLSVLDEVYSGLSRQIRDAQFQLLFHAQTQEVLTELGRTRSELHALRKEVDAIKEQQQQQQQEPGAADRG